MQTDEPCGQINSDDLQCEWFCTAVMPLDKELHRTIADQQKNVPTSDAKQCVICGQSFIPGSNRAKYCKACSVSVRREKKRQHEQKRKEG